MLVLKWLCRVRWFCLKVVKRLGMFLVGIFLLWLCMFRCMFLLLCLVCMLMVIVELFRLCLRVLLSRLVRMWCRILGLVFMGFRLCVICMFMWCLCRLLFMLLCVSLMIFLNIGLNISLCWRFILFVWILWILSMLMVRCSRCCDLFWYSCSNLCDLFERLLLFLMICSRLMIVVMGFLRLCISMWINWLCICLLCF